MVVQKYTKILKYRPNAARFLVFPSETMAKLLFSPWPMGIARQYYGTGS